MKYLFRIFSAVLLLFWAQESAAVNILNFKTLDARDGLTSSQVNSIWKDTRGFVWFGTPAGL